MRAEALRGRGLRPARARNANGVTPVEARIPTRMGDGFMVEMSRSELRADIEQATAAAAARAKVPPLTADEQAHLLLSLIHISEPTRPY